MSATVSPHDVWASRAGRVAAIVACAAALVAGSWVANPSLFGDAVPREAAATQRSLAPPTPRPAATLAVRDDGTPVAQPADAVDAYAAMRDDVNPKPRLQLIDAWAREPHPDGNVSLLSQALVDPDPSVRERAQVLFDRALEHR